MRAHLLSILFGIAVSLLFGALLVAFDQGIGDYLQYWSSAVLVSRNQNPYDARLLWTVQQVSGLAQYDEPILMWNPPFIIFPILWLGFFGAKPGAILWAGFSFASFLSSLALIRTYVRAPIRRSAPGGPFTFLALLTFYPLFLCLGLGQLSNFLLLSLALFLFFKTNNRNAFLGGLILSASLMKPHLLYLVYISILADVLIRRELKAALGLFVGAVVLGVLALLPAPQIWEWFADAASAPPIYWQTPTLGSWLQRLTSVHELWVRFLPSLLVTAAFVIWRVRHKAKAIDGQNLFALTTLSLLTSPYGWIYDQVLALPLLLIICGLMSELSRGPKKLFLQVALIGGHALTIITPAETGQQSAVWYPALLLAIWATLSRRPVNLN